MTKRLVFLVPGFFGFTSVGAVSYFDDVERSLGSALRRRGVDARIVRCMTPPTASIRRVGENPTPTMADYVGHIDYLVQLVGIDHVAIASDYTNQISMAEAQQKAGYKMMIDSGAWDKKTYPFDVLTYPQGVETPKTLFNLTDALLARGYKKEDLAKVWGGNWVRVMKAIVG